MGKTKRKIFSKGPLSRIEHTFQRAGLGFMFEWGWYETDEVLIHIEFLFINLFITINRSINTTEIDNTKDYGCYGRIIEKQRSYGFMVRGGCLELGYGKPGDWKEGQTTKRFYLSDIKEKIFGKPKYTEELGERKELSIGIPDLYDETKVNIHSYRYRHETRKRKYLLRTDVREDTDIEAIGDAPKIPGKGTCSHNCGDDSILGFSIKGHNDRADVIAKIARDVYYYRSYYPL